MRKILIVDDEDRIRAIYRDLLLSESFEILEAKNGEWACSLLMQHDNIDLVLLDIHMSAVNGQPLFNLIKNYSPKAKVIVSSIYPVEEQKYVIRGADDYFDKSEGMSLLLHKIKKVLTEEVKVEK